MPRPGPDLHPLLHAGARVAPADLDEIGGRHIGALFDVERTLRVLEDYKSLDVECAAMGLPLRNQKKLDQVLRNQKWIEANISREPRIRSWLDDPYDQPMKEIP